MCSHRMRVSILNQEKASRLKTAISTPSRHARKCAPRLIFLSSTLGPTKRICLPYFCWNRGENGPGRQKTADYTAPGSCPSADLETFQARAGRILEDPSS